MKVIIGAGGTGGHLYPALAFVEYIKEKNPEATFLFVGTKDRIESRVVPQKGYEYRGLHVVGLVGNPLEKLKAATIFIKSVFEAKKIIKQFKPDIVIGFGGYPSASIVKAAALMKVKTMIHEQNSIIGLTNKILIKDVDGIVCCYQKAYDHFPQEKTRLYGNPRASIDRSMLSTDFYQQYGLQPQRPYVVIVMGSLGSKTINDKMLELFDRVDKNSSYDILYVTGPNYFDEVKERVGTNHPCIHVVSYVDDMLSVLANASLVMSRAGASTLAEITSLGVPSLLVPSPYVSANHQEFNARELSQNGAATMILEKDISALVCFQEIERILQDGFVYESMKQASKRLGKPNASSDMYRYMMDIIGE